jgi:pimeloyl-ACP methyl ester carboxylesterase
MTTEAKVEDRTVLLNGLNFHYRDWGNNDAQTLVLLHGFTGHAQLGHVRPRLLRPLSHSRARPTRPW